MSLPDVILVGNAVAEPELRFTPQGLAIAKFTVACSSRKKVGEDWVDDKTLFMPVTLFKDVAEHAVESIEKGDEVMVTGRIYTNEWTTEDGTKRSRIVMDGNSVGVSLKFRTVPHGAGKTQRSQAGSAEPDPWAGAAAGGQGAPAAGGGPAADDNEPPF